MAPGEGKQKLSDSLRTSALTQQLASPTQAGLPQPCPAPAARAQQERSQIPASGPSSLQLWAKPGPGVRGKS